MDGEIKTFMWCFVLSLQLLFIFLSKNVNSLLNTYHLNGTTHSVVSDSVIDSVIFFCLKKYNGTVMSLEALIKVRDLGVNAHKWHLHTAK